jgi:hypothetical protein
MNMTYGPPGGLQKTKSGKQRDNGCGGEVGQWNLSGLNPKNGHGVHKIILFAIEEQLVWDADCL